jgi:hypothetical protein
LTCLEEQVTTVKVREWMRNSCQGMRKEKIKRILVREQCGHSSLPAHYI